MTYFNRRCPPVVRVTASLTWPSQPGVGHLRLSCHRRRRRGDPGAARPGVEAWPRGDVGVHRLVPCGRRLPHHRRLCRLVHEDETKEHGGRKREGGGRGRLGRCGEEGSGSKKTGDSRRGMLWAQGDAGKELLERSSIMAFKRIYNSLESLSSHLL